MQSGHHRRHRGSRRPAVRVRHRGDLGSDPVPAAGIPSVQPDAGRRHQPGARGRGARRGSRRPTIGSLRPAPDPHRHRLRLRRRRAALRLRDISPDAAGRPLRRGAGYWGCFDADAALPRRDRASPRARRAGFFQSARRHRRYLVAYLVGYAFAADGAWRWMLGLGATPGVILAVGMLLLQETPRWLAGHGHVDRARHELLRLRGPDVDIEPEWRCCERI